jgi:hypothetical protein
MQLVPVAPDEVPNFKEGRRGRVSYPLLKMFLESGLPVAKLDRTGMQNSMQSLTSCLTGYVRNHGLPVKIFTRSGDLYLARTDIDDSGNPVGGEFETDMDRLLRAGYTPQPVAESPEDVPSISPGATPITSTEVEQRFAIESGAADK